MLIDAKTFQENVNNQDIHFQQVDLKNWDS